MTLRTAGVPFLPSLPANIQASQHDMTEILLFFFFFGNTLGRFLLLFSFFVFLVIILDLSLSAGCDEKWHYHHATCERKACSVLAFVFWLSRALSRAALTGWHEGEGTRALGVVVNIFMSFNGVEGQMDD
jgi:hypothetical protein